MKHHRQPVLLTLAVLLLLCPLSSISAGAKQTLPENFLIIDSNGIHADHDTPYFVQIENMEIGELYEETIFLQNLETDMYTLYMQTDPVDSTGDVDLFTLSLIRLTLDGEIIYEGSPSGLGNIDMQQEPIKIGSFAVGETKILKFHAGIPEESWPGSLEGAAIHFNWIFTAEKSSLVATDPKGKEKPAQPPVTGVIVRTALLTILVVLLAIILLILYYCWKILRGSRHYVIIQQPKE